MASEGFVGEEGRVVPVAALAAMAASARGPAASASASGSAGAVRPVVLVDGRSGTGKTTLADQLAAEMGATIVHLDDVYPGWDGLDAAAQAVVADVLAPPDRTGRPGWRRWDWGTGLPAEWHSIDPTRPLVVEGCGALSRRSAERATLRVWLEGDDVSRKRRALDRDGEVFARQWDRWAAEEAAFIDREDPRARADLVLRLPAGRVLPA